MRKTLFPVLILILLILSGCGSDGDVTNGFIKNENKIGFEEIEETPEHIGIPSYIDENECPEIAKSIIEEYNLNGGIHSCEVDGDEIKISYGEHNDCMAGCFYNWFHARLLEDGTISIIEHEVYSH